MSTQEDCDLYLAQLLAQVGSILTGASDASVKAQFFDVLREFFDNSNAWLETINFVVVSNSLDYPLTPISGRILRLAGVVDQNNVQQNAVMAIPGIVHFLYPYTNTQPMTAMVVKNVDKPLECFPPDFPDWFLPAYGLGVQDGILGKMMAQPGNSWSDRATAMYHLQRFRDSMMHARVATRLANKVGGQAWAYPQQYRTTSQRGGVSTFNVNPAPTPLR